MEKIPQTSRELAELLTTSMWNTKAEFLEVAPTLIDAWVQVREAQLMLGLQQAERQELYTLMQQWGRNDDILYQKVREWVEAKLAALQSERDALREALLELVHQIDLSGAIDDHGHELKNLEALRVARNELSIPASGEPARKP